MAQSNTLIIRLLELIHASDEKSPINARQIAAQLEEKYQLKISRQMVYELIAVLKDCGYEIESCTQKNGGWYMKRHDFDEYQLKIMIDAVLQSKCLTEAESTTIMRQLLRLSSARGRRKLLSVYTPKASAKSIDSRTRDYLDLILEATLAEKKIIFNYTSLDKNMKRIPRMQDGKPKEYELNVFTLQWSDDNYYVIGGHDKYLPQLTHYRLDRMENLRISDNRMISKKILGDNPDYVIQSFIDREVDHFAGQAIRITLEFEENETNFNILADFAGKDVRISKGKDGKVQASFKKSNTPTLIGWLMRFADRFRVVAPDSLREDIKIEIRKLMDAYDM